MAQLYRTLDELKGKYVGVISDKHMEEIYRSGYNICQAKYNSRLLDMLKSMGDTPEGKKVFAKFKEYMFEETTLLEDD